MDEGQPASDERLANEIQLLVAMYPDQIQWHLKSRELRFKYEEKNVLELRLPDEYPTAGRPMLLSATTSTKQDVRQRMQDAIKQSSFGEGEEILDALIQQYQDIVIAANQSPGETKPTEKPRQSHDGQQIESNKVVIIWLHHLLATGKRKLAISPTMSGPKSANNSTPSGLSGITKPGYPGIMIFSGPTSFVDAHVAELKSQRWQAFQIRLEQVETVASGQTWKFAHGDSIIEVESMSDVVQDIVGKEKQDEFLNAIKVR